METSRQKGCISMQGAPVLKAPPLGAVAKGHRQGTSHIAPEIPEPNMDGGDLFCGNLFFGVMKMEPKRTLTILGVQVPPVIRTQARIQFPRPKYLQTKSRL